MVKPNPKLELAHAVAMLREVLNGAAVLKTDPEFLSCAADLVHCAELRLRPAASFAAPQPTQQSPKE